MATGRFNKIDALMIGNVQDEGSLFVRDLKSGATKQDFLNWLNTTMTGMRVCVYVRACVYVCMRACVCMCM